MVEEKPTHISKVVSESKDADEEESKTETCIKHPGSGFPPGFPLLSQR